MANLNPRVILNDRPANVHGPVPVIAAGNIPNDQVVAHNSMFAHRVKNFKAVHGNNAVLNELQRLNVKLDNQDPKRHNYAARELTQALRPVGVTSLGGPNAVGTMPQLIAAGGVFPGTVQELLGLTQAQITALRTFYNDNFGIVPGEAIEISRHKFGLYIGR